MKKVFLAFLCAFFLGSLLQAEEANRQEMQGVNEGLPKAQYIQNTAEKKGLVGTHRSQSQ